MGPQSHTAFPPHPDKQWPTEAPTRVTDRRYPIDRPTKATKTSEKEEEGIPLMRHHINTKNPTTKPRTTWLGDISTRYSRDNRTIECPRTTELSDKRKNNTYRS
jgi:hypothetical protein